MDILTVARVKETRKGKLLCDVRTGEPIMLLKDYFLKEVRSCTLNKEIARGGMVITPTQIKVKKGYPDVTRIYTLKLTELEDDIVKIDITLHEERDLTQFPLPKFLLPKLYREATF